MIRIWYLNYFTEIMQQLRGTTDTLQVSFGLYFQHWHRLLHQNLFIVKMLAWCACVSIYEREAYVVTLMSPIECQKEITDGVSSKR